MCTMCKGNDIDGVLHQLMDMINRLGWALISTSNALGVPFSYTVGLTSKRLPELYVEGLGPQQGAMVLNALARRQVATGEAFEVGQITQVFGTQLRLEARPDLASLVMVRTVFGDHDPVEPTALTVVAC